MAILIFIIILALLILVHELGHFFAAKWSNVRVDEFGIGFPPRALSYKQEGSETRYSLNWVPLGGFVKIFGEESTEDAVSGPDSKRSFLNKSKLTQIWILAAGVTGNIIAAWLFFSLGFMIGMPASVSSFDEGVVSESAVVVTAILPGSPAEDAGLQAGDELLEIKRGTEAMIITDSADIGEFIGEDTTPISLLVERAGAAQQLELTPVAGLVENQAAIGIGVDEVGIVSLPPQQALWQSVRVTANTTGLVAVGLVDFIANAFTGQADLSQVTGPVGLVGLVEDAGALGFTYLLSFTAFISINLALINLIPFPALDGGRILFVIIEAAKGSPIRPKVANALNAVGFALLILLMLVVTYNDVIRLVSG